MAGSTIGPILPTRINISSTYISYKVIENIALNVTLLTNVFLAPPVYYRINAHSIFVDIEFSYSAENK